MCCCVMFAYPNVVTIMSLTWLIGMAISVLYTVPLILLAKYHQSSSYVRKVNAVSLHSQTSRQNSSHCLGRNGAMDWTVRYWCRKTTVANWRCQL